MWFVILTGALLMLYFINKLRVYKHWKNKGVPYVKPWPIIGNMGPNLFKYQTLLDLILDLYNAHKDKRCVGIYQFLQPVLMIRDPNLIKTITVKEFATFPDHAILKQFEDDYVASKNLFCLKNDNGWQKVRATLSPFFTSSKLRNTFLLTEQCVDQFVSYFQKESNIVSLNMKDVFTKYINDAIGTSAFGISCNSLKDPKNEFYIMGKNLADFSGFRSIIFLGYAICPRLMKWLQIKAYNKKTINFFKNFIIETIKLRQEKQIIRHDIINLLMEAQNPNGKRQLTDEDIVAQAVAFFTAGFETVSTTLSFCAYELAINPQVQIKLRKEVNSALENCRGRINYDTLLDMNYLDCVILETLRKWPAAIFTERVSVKPITLHLAEDQLYLETGTVCWIPIYAIHMDPEHYPAPKKYDPERFCDENKHKIKQFTYLPFGAGPRSCLGSRFGLLIIKLLLVKLIHNFEIVPVKETPIPLVISKDEFALLSGNSIWLGFKKLNSNISEK